MTNRSGLLTTFGTMVGQGRTLQWVGYFAIVAFPILYSLRYTKPEAPPYDDWWLRLIGMFLAGGLALRHSWPDRLKPYYVPFAYVALIYCLPFFCVFASLVAGGGEIGVMNTMMAVFFIVLITDWKNTALMLTIGFAAAAGAYFVLAPEPIWPENYIARAPVALICIVGGMLYKRTERENIRRNITNERAETLRDTLAFLAHELNTPLATIRLCTSFLAARFNTDQPAKQGTLVVSEDRPGEILKAINRAESRALYCQSVLSTFVQSARDAHRASNQPTTTAQTLVRSLVDNYPFDENRPILTIEAQGDFWLPGRRDLVYLVLCAVTENAIKAMRSTQRPRLKLSVLYDDSGQGRIQVADNGPGISPELMAVLSQTPVPSEGGGHGMGLLFGRRVMESLQGALEISSEVGEGTVVTIVFRKDVRGVT